MNKNLLIIALVWPEPDATAAGNRMIQLIHFFLEQNLRITVASTATESKLSMDLQRMEVSKVTIELNNSSFDDFIIKLKPDVVLFDRFLTEEQFGWRIAEFVPDALRILDTEDLHSLRKTRESCFKKGISFSKKLWMQNDITKREIASIYRSDISLIISDYEMQLLKDEINIDEHLLLYLPFMVEPLSDTEIVKFEPIEQRKDFICIGNGKHTPNVDAIVWLKTEIWPLIREELPNTMLHIYGAYLPAKVQQMHNEKEGFLIHGWAANVKNVMESARINLAPLRFGAGLKGKLLDAMLYGTPSIASAIGAEGMYDEPEVEFNGAIVETTQDFVNAAVLLYSDALSWKVAQSKGTKILHALFNKEVHEANLKTRIISVQSNLDGHRTKNFVGSLLLHQTLASTKFMAKWIEEKNKD